MCKGEGVQILIGGINIDCTHSNLCFRSNNELARCASFNLAPKRLESLKQVFRTGCIDSQINHAGYRPPFTENDFTKIAIKC
jgi:hypothetical protein